MLDALFTAIGIILGIKIVVREILDTIETNIPQIKRILTREAREEEEHNSTEIWIIVVVLTD